MGQETRQQARSPLSPLRAWCALLAHCVSRQARAQQMVFIAVALLGLTAALIAVFSATSSWSMKSWGYWMRIGPETRGPSNVAVFPPPGQRVRLTYDQAVTTLETLPTLVEAAATPLDLTMAPDPAALAVLTAVSGSARAVLDNTGFFVFSTSIVFLIFTGFLLPIWSLSFATEALSGEREGRTLVWLFSRPLPRWSIYLAKFLAILPWSLGLNLGGFAIICYLAGDPGRLAFRLYWPAILGATLAYSALYHFMGAAFRRAAVVALVYSFFLETILGSMPGYLKRISVSFYTRCLMFDLAEGYDVYTEKPSIYLPVDGATAWWVLGTATACLLALGMWIFSRTEYQDLT